MKILFIVPYPIEGASTRHRVVSYFSRLAKDGHQFTLSPFMSEKFYRIVYYKGKIPLKVFYFFLGILQRFFDIFRAPFYDIVFIHLDAFPLGSTFFEKTISLLNKKIIYDLDDAIFLKNTSASNSFIAKLKSKTKYNTLIKLSKAVICCNQYLENYAQNQAPNKKTITIHTPVDTDQFIPENKKNNSELTLGWIGSFTTAKYLEIIFPVLKELAINYKFQVNIVGAGYDIQIPNVKINNIPWTLENDIINFQNLDIGLYPLPNDEWVKGKTGFKTMQYMSVGVPCVVSNVGANCNIIKDGINGFLVNSLEQWYERLEMLINDQNLRKKIGTAGRKTIIKDYSVNSNYNKLIETFSFVQNTS